MDRLDQVRFFIVEMSVIEHSFHDQYYNCDERVLFEWISRFEKPQGLSKEEFRKLSVAVNKLNKLRTDKDSKVVLVSLQQPNVTPESIFKEVEEIEQKKEEEKKNKEEAKRKAAETRKKRDLEKKKKQLEKLKKEFGEA